MSLVSKSTPPIAFYTGVSSVPSSTVRFIDLTNTVTGNAVGTDLALGTDPTTGNPFYRQPMRGIWLQNQDGTNSLVVNQLASSSGWLLAAGDKEFFPISDITQLNFYAASGATVGYAVI